MKRPFLALTLLISISRAVMAQDHLISENDVLGEPSDYRLKIRHVFGQAFEEGVILRAVVLPSFEDEYAVGIQVRDGANEVFVLEPSSRIWHTELLKLYEAGKIVSMTRERKRVPLDENKSYQELKRKTPADYRKIQANRKARPIPKDVAEVIQGLWEQRLVNAKQPDERGFRLDGVEYHFSARLEGKGEVSGSTWSPEPDSKPGRLVTLTNSLADYARGKVSLRDLSVEFKKANAP